MAASSASIRCQYFLCAVLPSFRGFFSETKPLIIDIHNYASGLSATMLGNRFQGRETSNPPGSSSPDERGLVRRFDMTTYLPLTVCLKVRTHIPGFVGIVGALTS